MAFCTSALVTAWKTTLPYLRSPSNWLTCQAMASPSRSGSVARITSSALLARLASSPTWRLERSIIT